LVYALEEIAETVARQPVINIQAPFLAGHHSGMTQNQQVLGNRRDIVPDHVHVMYDGRIVKSGDKSLALELEAKGYDWIKKELAASAA
jgi:Fe-S cluster assembly ATPase SufC